MPRTRTAVLTLLALACSMLFVVLPSQADDTLRQEIVLSDDGTGTVAVYVRAPLSFLFADHLNSEPADGLSPLLERRSNGTSISPQLVLSPYGLEEYDDLFTHRLSDLVSIGAPDASNQPASEVSQYRLINTHPRFAFSRPIDAQIELSRDGYPGAVALNAGHIAFLLTTRLPVDAPLVIQSNLQTLQDDQATEVKVFDFRNAPNASKPRAALINEPWLTSHALPASSQ